MSWTHPYERPSLVSRSNTRHYTRPGDPLTSMCGMVTYWRGARLVHPDNYTNARRLCQTCVEVDWRARVAEATR
jgi:hypothetical protein